ncbi:MAG: hypothetical protein HS117_07035 [Verrucomicrobiaceae bacterium]|nr:hypothetical protein [Verrucomicrobiaceae bacterium]
MPAPIEANPGYASGQLSKALKTADTHGDPVVRERALAKAEQWQKVLQGMCAGSFDIGSRRPMANVPTWATPEVVTGGFVTGSLLAGGPLGEHELAILESLGGTIERGRQIVNEFFLTAPGLTILTEWLHNGCYEIHVPEEGALLVVAWLMENEQPASAASIIQEISPFFDRLRFYPVPAAEPRMGGAEVSIQTTREAIAALNRVADHKAFSVQKEMICIWTPMMDRLVELLLETVEGEPPDLARDENGHPLPVDAKGRFPVIGGWPCKSIHPGWTNRVAALLEEYRRVRGVHRLCMKPDRADDNFRQLRDILTDVLPDIGRLHPRDLGRIRMIVARYLAKHGQPGSQQRQRLRAEQLRSVVAPLHSQLAQVVVRRLKDLPLDVGISDPSPFLQPVSREELPAALPNQALPESIAWKVTRAQRDSMTNLVTMGVITSGESLALVLPKVTAEIDALGIADESLRRVYAELYRSFRKRRSLLLLNLESQVRLEELPWVAATKPWRAQTQETRVVAAAALREISTIALSSFPETIVPNRLVRELANLAKQAGLDLPLVEEIAADIFMGEFGPKFLRAAKAAADELKETLYQTYYQADFAAISKMPDPTPEKMPRFAAWWSRASQQALDPFSQLCSKRTEADAAPYRGVAANGMMIEQQQILTTHNLSVLMKGLNLPVQRLAAAQRCWRWIIRRLGQKTTSHHARLIMVKNTAYAWRQMIYFLSGLSKAAQMDFLAFMRAMLYKEPEKLGQAVDPAIRGLHLAILGSPPQSSADSKLFLGWTTGSHWLIEKLGE